MNDATDFASGATDFREWPTDFACRGTDFAREEGAGPQVCPVSLVTPKSPPERPSYSHRNTVSLQAHTGILRPYCSLDDWP